MCIRDRVKTNTAITAQPATSTTRCLNGTAPILSFSTNGTNLSYQWYTNTINNTSSGTLISGATGTSFTASTASSGTTYYYAIITGDCGTVTTNTAAVIINALPTATISAGGATTFCQGGSVTLTSSSGSSYLWSNGATTSSITVSDAGDYSVQITNSNGCQSSASTATTVTVNATPSTPTISASGATTFCQGESVTLTSSTDSSYLWSNGATTSSITVSDAGDYSVQITNSNGCQSSASTATTVTVNATPSTPTISASGATTFCQGGSVTLTSSTGSSYAWSNGAITNSITVYDSGDYSVQVTNANGCQSTASTATTVTVNATPVVTASDVTGCAGTAITLAGSTTSTGGTGSYSVSNPYTGSNATYTYTYTDGNGCTATSNYASITVNSNVTATFSIASSICSGTTAPSLSTTSDNGISGSWSPSTISNTASGTYTFTPTTATQYPSCYQGTSVTVTVTDPNVTPTFSQVGPICSGDTLSSLPVTSEDTMGITGTWSPSLNNTATTTYTFTPDAGQCAVSTTMTITVNPNLPASVSIQADVTTICAGASVTFTATPTNGGSTPSYQWKVNDVNVDGETSSTFTSNTLANSDVVTVVMSSSASPCSTNSPATSNPITITVNPSITAAVSIGATATSICAGTNVIFTATPTNGGSAPSYQWQINGSNVGTNSASFSSSALNDADEVSVIMTSNATSCITSASATSNIIVISVNPNLPASVNIDATATSICSGTSVTFTATPTNGGLTPTYQWKVNGNNVSGQTTSTFTSTTLSDNDVVSVVMVSNASPCLTGSPATSNTITMAVSPTANSGTISDTAFVCSGSSTTVSISGTVGAIQWQVSTDGANWTDILGANSAILNTGNLTVTTYYQVIVTSGSCAPATSDIVAVIVNDSITASIFIEASATTICSGTSVTFTATPTNEGDSPSYQWQINGSNVSGATDSTFTYSSFTNNDVVKVVLSSNATPCLANSQASSNELTMTVNPNSTSEETQVACDSYTWNGTTYTASGDYTSTSINNYGCTNIATLHLTIKSSPIISVQPVSTSICRQAGASASLSVEVASGATPSYSWYSQAVDSTDWTLLTDNANYQGTSTSTITITKTDYGIPALGTKYKVEVSSLGCTSLPSDVIVLDEITMSRVQSITPVTSLSPALTTCAGSQVELKLAAGSIGNIQWQTSIDNVNWTNGGNLVVQSDVNAINDAIYFTSDTLTQDTWFRVIASNGICSSVISPSKKITVNQPTAVGTLSADSTTICKGSGATLTLSSSQGTVAWWWAPVTNGVIGTYTPLWGNSSNTLSTNLNSSKAFKAIVSSDACSSSTSNPVTVQVQTVTSLATNLTVVGTLTPALTVCQGSTVNLSLASGSIGNIQWMYSSNSGLTWTSFHSDTQSSISAINGVLTYISPTLSGTTAWFKVVATNGICSSTESSILKITVSTSPASGSISGGNVTVCAPASAALNLSGNTTSFNNSTTLNVSNYTPGATLLWQKSVNYINSTGATPVWTAAGSTTNVLTATNLTVDTWYRVKVTNGSCFAFTDVVKITVSKTALSGTINTLNTNVCYGGDISFTAGSYTGDSIQWEISTTSASSGFTPVSGATNNTYSMINVTYAPSSSFYVRYVVTSGTCTIARSATKTIKVNPLSIGGTVTGGGTVCVSGGGTLKLTGNTGTIQWQYSVGGTPYSNVPTGSATASTFGTTSTSGTASTYVVTNITGATSFRALVTSGVCSSTTSNVVQYVIGTNAYAGILSALSTTVCAGSGTTLNLSGYVGSVVRWEKSTNWTTSSPTWTSVTSTSPTLSTGNLSTSTAFRAVVTIGCNTVTSSNIVINVPVAVAKTITGNTGTSSTSPVSICSTSTKLLTYNTIGSVGAIQWQYYNGGSSTIAPTSNAIWTDISGANGSTYNAPSLGQTGNVWFRVKLTSSPCSAVAYTPAVNVWLGVCSARTVVSEVVTTPVVVFSVMAHPSPFTENFTLNVTTPSEDKVQVMVYDMIGKLVDQREVSASDAVTLEIGDRFPSGVYNVIAVSYTHLTLPTKRIV